MPNIASLISGVEKGPSPWSRPLILDLNNPGDLSDLQRLIKSGKIRKLHDKIDLAFSELFDIEHPSKKDTKTNEELKEYIFQQTKGSSELYGVWVYYPWSGDCVHFPPEQQLRQLRTARNRNLITDSEQQKLYKSTLLILGLSVGSSAAEMLLSQGIGGKFILVDMDAVEPTNLNRIKTVYSEVGTHKVDLVAKRISETDPFIDQVHIKEGLNENNAQQIIAEHTPDVIIDEMDSLKMKMIIRELATHKKLPVIMATDDGENAILDIERYDTNPAQKPFEGRIPEEIRKKVFDEKLSRPEMGLLIGKHFVGPEHIPLRMFESLVQVGKTIPSWPQLAGAATLSGIALAYCAKKIILKQPLHAGRHIFDMDKELDPSINTSEHRQQLKKFQQLFFD